MIHSRLRDVMLQHDMRSLVFDEAFVEDVARLADAGDIDPLQCGGLALHSRCNVFRNHVGGCAANEQGRPLPREAPEHQPDEP